MNLMSRSSQSEFFGNVCDLGELGSSDPVLTRISKVLKVVLEYVVKAGARYSG